MEPEVIIFILNWNSYNDTIACITSLKKIRYNNFSIKIIDNASTNNSVEEISAKFPELQIIVNEKNIGVAGGYNVALTHFLQTDAKYILLLNNDIVVDKYFLAEMIKIAESEERIGIVAPKNYYLQPSNKIFSAGSKIHKVFGTTIEIGHNKVDKGQFNKSYELDYATGAALLIKRKVIETIGMLDERFFMYWEETDFCYRAKKAGYKIIFAPKAIIWHKVGSSTGGHSTPFYLYYRVRNNLLFLKKHSNNLFWYIFFNLYMLEKIGVIFLSRLIKGKKGVFKKIKAIYNGYFDFFNNRFGRSIYY